MYGSDFPFVLERENGGYYKNSRLFFDWKLTVTSQELDHMLHGTVEDLFGPWGATPSQSPQSPPSKTESKTAPGTDSEALV